MSDQNKTDVTSAEGTGTLKPAFASERKMTPMRRERAGKNTVGSFIGGLPGQITSPVKNEFAKVVPQDGPSKIPRIAIIAVHGMGIRQPYDTLDEHAQMLQRNLEISCTTCEVATVNGCALPRLKMAYKKSDGVASEVHVYEAYWAPITKGQVTVKDAIGFLTQTGFNGLAFARATTFKDKSRFAFNQWWAYPTELWMVTLFPFILSFVAALVALNTALGAIATSKFLQTGSSTASITSSSSNLGLLAMSLIPAMLSMVVLGACLVVTTLMYKYSLKRARNEKGTPKSVSKFRLDWIFIYLTMLLIIAAPLLLLANSLFQHGPAVDYFKSVGEVFKSIGTRWAGIVVVIILGVGLWASGFIKKYIVDYLGDLTVYLSVNQTVRFYDLRKRVRETVKTVLQNVYSARVAGQPQNHFVYDKIIVSAHSLGTAIAYDALNDLIADDIRATAAMKLNVVERTKLLATCGSPLDKYAYLFRNRQIYDFPYREGEAQAGQPMITSYDYRPAEWVNVWTPQDPISGDLGFYDDFEDTAHKSQWIQNYVDTLGSVPFACHSYYFENVVLGQQIAARL